MLDLTFFQSFVPLYVLPQAQYPQRPYNHNKRNQAARTPNVIQHPPKQILFLFSVLERAPVCTLIG